MSSNLPLPPTGFSRDANADRLLIRRSWRAEHSVSFCVAFTVFWNVCVGVWFFNTDIPWAVPALDEWLPWLFAGLGIFMVYACICTFVNTLSIELTPQLLQVTTRPLPWCPDRRLETRRIRSVVIRERVVKDDGNVSIVYYAVVVLDSGEEKKLVGGKVDGIDRRELDFYVREIRDWLERRPDPAGVTQYI